MPEEILVQLQTPITTYLTAIASQLNSWRGIRDADGLLRMEQDLAALGRTLGDNITEIIVGTLVEDKGLVTEMTEAAKSSGTYRGGEMRPVTIHLLGGGKMTIRTPYLKPRKQGRRGRPRRVGRRGQGGAGLYPVLAALGIWFFVTPALSTEICRQVADSDSVRSGREALARRGIDLGHKQTQRIVNKTSRRLVELRQKWLTAVLQGGLVEEGVLVGKRVVIATDGGRVRERLPARAGRPRTQTGHRRYDAPWREPKLFTIYTVDENGQVDESFRPVYDGTLGDSDAIFRMLAGYLKAMSIHRAREVIVIGDGAKWIWNRISDLAAAVGLAPERIVEIIDWYHAVEVLHKIAAIPARWSSTERERWVKKVRRLLYAGNIEGVVKAIDELSKGRRAKEISKHRDYFARNAKRMQYSSFKKARLPLGSGAVESAVRRVINLRMKGNGIFWLEANAEGMLLLRCYLKTRRFDDLMRWYGCATVPWWSGHGRAAHVSSPIYEAA